MKLSRRPIVGLLLFGNSIVIALLLWSWVVWPEATLQAFLTNCAAERFGDAEQSATSDLVEYLAVDSQFRRSLSYNAESANWPIPTLVYNPKREFRTRTFLDLLTGKQRLTAIGAEAAGRTFTVYEYELTARFGKVSCKRTVTAVMRG